MKYGDNMRETRCVICAEMLAQHMIAVIASYAHSCLAYPNTTTQLQTSAHRTWYQHLRATLNEQGIDVGLRTSWLKLTHHTSASSTELRACRSSLCRKLSSSTWRQDDELWWCTTYSKDAYDADVYTVRVYILRLILCLVLLRLVTSSRGSLRC